MKPKQSTTLVQTQQLRLNMGLATSIRILRYDASGLTRYLEEQAAINPFLSLHPVEPAPGEWLPHWTGAFRRRDTDYGAVTEAVQAGPSPSLASHASAAIDRLVPAGRGRALALALVQALEPSGWLGRPLDVIATEAGASLPEIEAILAVMQRIDPPGLFARSLAECLRLQAADAGCLDAGMAGMLDNLDLLASGNLARLARVCRITEAEVARRLALIRSFDPKPGTQFDASPLPSGEPDLLVTRGENGWQVALNRSALPELRITAPQKRPTDPDTRATLATAKALGRIVQSRNATLLRIGREILRRQEAVLDRGKAALLPMTMAEVAEVLSLHMSTVSRAIAGVSVDTPGGTFWLRRLFTNGLPAAPGHSAGAVRARLAQLVASEDPASPLSDQAMTNTLAQDGVALARRTVAKYRETLNIPPAHRRRKRC